MGIFKNVSEMDSVGAVWMGADMGFKNSILISPAHLRQYFFPWTKRCAEIAHLNQLPFLLHSCGNRDEIMEDLIDDVKIDAIHSFEDVIMPVTEAKKKYGDRITILGGVDMDILGREDLNTATEYIENVLANCVPGGGYVLGSGNSAANYLKIGNYKKMLQMGRWYQYLNVQLRRATVWKFFSIFLIVSVNEIISQNGTFIEVQMLLRIL